MRSCAVNGPSSSRSASSSCSNTSCATSGSSCPASGSSRRSGATTRSPPRTPSRCSCRTCAASSRRGARRGCCTRSAGRGTCSVARPFAQISIRWRLAVVSAALTFVILAMFAVVIGQVTASRVRSDFNNQVAAAVDDLSDRFSFHVDNVGNVELDGPPLNLYAASNSAVIRVLQRDGRLLDRTSGAPNFGILLGRTAETGGYRIETRVRNVPVKHTVRPLAVPLIIQCGRPTSVVEATVSRIRLFLAGGVLGGTLLALLGGLLVGRRAMAPIAALTAGAREIAETRDPGRSLPSSKADDEVTELGRTLQTMLDNL